MKRQFRIARGLAAGLSAGCRRGAETGNPPADLENGGQRPQSGSRFNGINLVGRLTKDVEKGTFVINVDAVPLASGEAVRPKVRRA